MSLIRTDVVAFRRGISFIVGVAGVSALLAAAPASAAAAWFAPIDISASGVRSDEANAPRLAVDRKGAAVAVWTKSTSMGDVVQAAARTVGGVWQTPVDLSAAGLSAGSPDVAMDGNGDATAVWESSGVLQSAVRPAGGVWQPAVDVANDVRPQDSLSSGSYLKVAVDFGGTAVVVWEGGDDTLMAVKAAVRPAGGGWQPPAALTAEFHPSPGTEDDEGPDVAIDDKGKAVAVWNGGPATPEVPQSAMRPVGGVWGTTVNVVAPGMFAGFTNPHVAIDANGIATVVWGGSDADGDQIMSATETVAPLLPSHPLVRRPPGLRWGAPTRISVPIAPIDHGGGLDFIGSELPQVAVDGNGDTVAAWVFGSNELDDGYPLVVQGAVRLAHGGWQPPATLSPANAAYVQRPGVAIDGMGNTTVVWTGGGAAQAVSRPVGGAWQSPVDLGPSAVYANGFSRADVAVDGQGNATALWEADDAGQIVMRSASTSPHALGSRSPTRPASKSSSSQLRPSSSSSPDSIASMRRVTTVNVGDGSVSLGTPRACVASGKAFIVTLSSKQSEGTYPVFLNATRVAFVVGHTVRIDRTAPFRQSLRISPAARPGSTVRVRARGTLRLRHGRSLSRSVLASVNVCSQHHESRG